MTHAPRGHPALIAPLRPGHLIATSPDDEDLGYTPGTLLSEEAGLPGS